MTGLIAALAATALCAPAATAGTVSPLPASDYGVRPVCAPSAPRHAGCLSLQLVPRTAAARAHTHPLGRSRPGTRPSQVPSPAAGDFGLRPQDLHAAYQLPSTASSTQTIALVDAYHDLTAEEDLGAYGQMFGLSGECTAANGCFKQVNQEGQAGNPPFPKTSAELELARKGTPEQQEEAQLADGWALETSLDVQVARATCQNCRILLVEANSPSYEDLERAEETAIALGATVVSNSWGGPEEGETPALESASPFNHPGTVITASAGDNGYLGWDAENPSERGFTEFPASSPHVVSVGGTRLSLGAGSAWAGESVWNGNGAGGGGCSVEFTAQPWQQGASGWPGVGCGSKRAVADVSADADPYTGAAVHYSSPLCETTYEEAGVEHVLHWCTIGGTSLASPLIASAFALAGGAGGVQYPARTLYERARQSPGALHDVLTGSNGACAKGFDPKTGVSSCTPAEEAAASCPSKLICLAATGYDGPSGVGTPNGILAFQPTSAGEESGTPGSEGAPAAQTGAGGVPPAAAGPPVSTAAPPAPGASARISRLALTPGARVALGRGHAMLSQLGFAFSINLPARLHATLAKRVSSHGRTRWQSLRGSANFNVAGGYNRRRLRGRSRLSAGLYRLTLSPVRGPARSILFRVG
jgi:hypothetical protein